MPRGRQTARLPYLLLLASSALLAAAPTNAAPQAAPQSSASPDAAAILPTDLTEQVVVSANLTATPADQVGSSVTVVDAATIAAAGKTSTFELLRAVPGVDVVQSGGAGRTATVFLRGANSAHTLVLVDGVRINSPASGEVDFADLRAEQIERIEILRGPQSSLYGSEAIGGVINIVTRRGAPGARGDVSLEGGNAGAWRAAA
ncbi:MAG TPA: TonB-dependent receptor plug domain-containing protein, partial [Acidobacteriota bacterium]|nr:TonB-dependent receptor plug domain-containing protein [Acidobacteriota bacterium]